MRKKIENCYRKNYSENKISNFYNKYLWNFRAKISAILLWGSVAIMSQQAAAQSTDQDVMPENYSSDYASQ